MTNFFFSEREFLAFPHCVTREIKFPWFLHCTVIHQKASKMNIFHEKSNIFAFSAIKSFSRKNVFNYNTQQCASCAIFKWKVSKNFMFYSSLFVFEDGLLHPFKYAWHINKLQLCHLIFLNQSFHSFNSIFHFLGKVRAIALEFFPLG